MALVAGLALTGTCLAAPHGGPRGGYTYRGHGPVPMHNQYRHSGYHHHHGGHHTIHRDGWIAMGTAAIVGGVIGALCGR